MEILGSRVIVRPRDPARSVAFYRDVLGLAVSREFPGGTVFFLGNGLLEVSGGGGAGPGEGTAIWVQVRDLAACERELRGKGIEPVRGPRREPWGLDEMWIADPDGLRIVLVQVPADHPMRLDSREL